MTPEERKVLFEISKLLGWAYFALALFKENTTITIARIQINAARENVEKYTTEAD